MANYKSAKKRIKVNERRRIENMMIKSKVRTAIKKVQAAVTSKANEQLDTLLRDAIVQLDKSCSKGIFHKNTVARKKSRLSRQVAKLASHS